LAEAEEAEKGNSGSIKPRLFDVRDHEILVIKPWKTVVLDPKYCAAWIVAGDLTGNGVCEIVSARARNVKEDGDKGAGDNHYTCSVVAHRLDGSVLWKWGNPAIGRNKLWHDTACQIYDWDGDGKNEVIILAKGAIVELDGATGKEKRRIPIPAHSSDCIVFANLSGNERPTDILVKTRYTQIWAYNREGKQLWKSKTPGGYRVAHQPRPIDIDGDGKDEIMAGYAMLNPDGSIRWVFDKEKEGPFGGHLDCARLFSAGEKPSDCRIIATFCGGNRISMVDGEGSFIWSLFGHHFESADIGKVCPDVQGKQIVVDIDHKPFGESPLWVLDEKGSLLGRIVTDYSRFHFLIDWFGNGTEAIVNGHNRAMYDGKGRTVAIFDMPSPEGQFICQQADMTGSGVPDVIFGKNPGSVVYIYKNENGKKPESEVPLGSEFNFTLY